MGYVLRLSSLPLKWRLEGGLLYSLMCVISTGGDPKKDSSQLYFVKGRSSTLVF